MVSLPVGPASEHFRCTWCVPVLEAGRARTAGIGTEASGFGRGPPVAARTARRDPENPEKQRGLRRWPWSPKRPAYEKICRPPGLATFTQAITGSNSVGGTHQLDRFFAGRAADIGDSSSFGGESGHVTRPSSRRRRPSLGSAGGTPELHARPGHDVYAARLCS